MSYQSVTIPLDHLDPEYSSPFRRFHRNYTSDRLSETLKKISGDGRPGLWWSEEEAIEDLWRRPKINWSWCPCGEVDFRITSQLNKWSHMRIFFRDPQHAMLFKLTWL